MLKLRGDVVRRLISDAGYRSETEFAARHGFVQSTFAGWISGRRGIKREQLKSIADILNIDMYLICDPVARRLSRMDEDIKTIRELFLTMTDDQRTKVISVALALLDGSEVE